ncbi:MAG TPA: hypothetical protein VF532_11565 [Candidatus Angelobacter sp.]
MIGTAKTREIIVRKERITSAGETFSGTVRLYEEPTQFPGELK